MRQTERGQVHLQSFELLMLHRLTLDVLSLDADPKRFDAESWYLDADANRLIDEVQLLQR
jgi:hypothetical protein